LNCSHAFTIDRLNAFRNDGKRRISRRLSDASNDVNDATDITPVAPKRLRLSPRFLGEYCYDIAGLEHKHQCDGCQRWNNTLIKRKGRAEYVSKELQCFQAWKLKENQVPKAKHAHWLAVTTHLSNKLHIDPKAVVSDVAAEAETTTNSTVEETTTTNENGVTPSPPKRKVNWNSKVIRSQGQNFAIEYPASHELCHISDVKRWQNDSDTLQRIRNKLVSKQYKCDDMFSQTLWSIIMSTVPSLAMSAAQVIIPLIIMAFFWDTGLFHGVAADAFSTSCPSDATLRKYTLCQAARDTMSLGRKISTKKIYLSCDKGNEKGIGHFVKYLSWWNPDDPKVDVQLLDIDASGGTSAACASAMQAFINKLRMEDNDGTNLLCGQTTDSGGGGVLEDLHNKMDPLGICIADDDSNKYLVANCTIHALQLQLAAAVRETFGEGSLDKVNATQMLHTAYRLQECIDGEEWRHILRKSSMFVANYDPSVVDNMNPTNANERNLLQFYESYNKTLKFHSAFKKGEVDEASKRKLTVLEKMQAPILTRWWTVGVSSSYCFDHYLILYHACQTVINLYPSSATPNSIASDLFAMMSDQEMFVDVTLIRCFHKAYLNKHFDWFQSSDDLTSALGFQSHNIVGRYFLMDQDLRSMMTSGRSMHEYHEAVNNWQTDPSERLKHMDKLKVFVHQAYDMLHKHFKRWLGAPLLPCALMSEAPLAKVVASIMLGHEFPTSFGDDASYNVGTETFKFLSEAHSDCETIDLNRFDKFLRQQIVDNGIAYTDESLEAARLIVDKSIDFRSFDYQDQDHGLIRLHMHAMYLPLASQTQFVERGVKEAKYVSATDRSEEQRSCMAIIRSHTPLTRSKLDAETSHNSSRIQSLIESATERASQHNLWEANQEDREYDARIAQLRYSLKVGHFKMERIEGKKEKIDENSNKFKKQNVTQRIKPQTKTAAVSGLIPYGKLTKARNMEDLKTELLTRGVPESEINPATITERKDKLKELEINRLMEDERMVRTDAVKVKAFKMLSEAPFKLTD